jgi:glutamyl-tRNA reductase
MRKSPEDRRQIMPVSLLAENRTALVVGAGKIACRKINHLIDAAARVVVVGARPSADVVALAEAGRIQHVARDFESSDLDGVFLAFAATNDTEVNARILTECKARSVLCCAVDKNWRDSDFVTPATVRKDELTVSVSTAGQSCRRSRMVKESLARHLDKVDSADLLIIGTSHDYLTVDEREPFHLAGKRLQLMGRMLMQIWGVHEFMILNTCNRIEVHVVVADHEETRLLLERLMGFDALDPSGYYIKRGMDAFGHSAVLLAGLLSQTPGENHIVAQVKDAVADAVEAGWAAGMIQGWLSSSLHVSKHIRKETQPLLRNFEIEDLCIDYLTAEYPACVESPLLVLGAGVVGSGIVKRFLSRVPDGKCIWCYHINRPEVLDDVSDRISLCDFNSLKEELSKVAAVVCATSSPGHVLHQGHALFLDQENDVSIVDLAMPRNVSPELNGITPNILVADLDDLKHWYRREAADMSKIMECSSRITSEHQEMYDKLTSSFQSRNALKCTGSDSVDGRAPSD